MLLSKYTKFPKDIVSSVIIHSKLLLELICLRILPELQFYELPSAFKVDLIATHLHFAMAIVVSVT